MSIYLILLYSFYSGAGVSPRYIEDGWMDGVRTPFLAKQVGLDHEGRPLLLRQDAADAYAKLASQAQQAGIAWEINSAYRSTRDQRRMLRKRRRWAAPLGMSQHQAGIAVDLSGMSVRCSKKRKRRCRSEAYKWLARFGPKLGWYNTAPREPWHWVYVGTANSEALKSETMGRRMSLLAPPECQY